MAAPWPKRKPKKRARPNQTRKSPVATMPIEVLECKKQFLSLLAEGLSPGAACEEIELSRSAAYAWRKDDKQFENAWENAVQTALDKLETTVFKRAMKGSIADAHYTLNKRRYDRQDVVRQTTNYVLNVSLSDHIKRLEQLGLPVPVVEGDFEEKDAPVIQANHP